MLPRIEAKEQGNPQHIAKSKSADGNASPGERRDLSRPHVAQGITGHRPEEEHPGTEGENRVDDLNLDGHESRWAEPTQPMPPWPAGVRGI